MKKGNNESADICCKLYNWICVGTTTEGVSYVSDMKCCLCLLKDSEGNFNESNQTGTKLYKFRGLGKKIEEVINKKFG